MAPAIQRLTRLFSRLFATGAGVSMLAIFLIVFVNSARRYSIGKSFEWGEELPVYLAVYGIMFGAAWAYIEDRHVRFTILLDFLPERHTRGLYMAVDAVMVVIGSLLAYSGYLFAARRGGVEASGLVSLARDLAASTGWEGFLILGQLFPYQLAMAVGGVCLVCAAAMKLLLRVGGERTVVHTEGS